MDYTWYGCTSLPDFPWIDTSQVTTMIRTWFYARNLLSFPLIDTSQVTNFAATWQYNTSLSSFPQIDCRSATSLNLTWDNCQSLEVFPSGVFDNTSGTTDFSTTFNNTKLNTQSIDNVLLSVNKANTSDGTITLNSTNMQTPGVGGTYAKHQLENRGWTVNTKAVTNDVVVSSVFFEGESAWYDVNDLTTLYQNSWGTIPVTTAGQPVGLMLDKSKGLELGPNLITNGTFDTDTDWSKDPGVTISGGVASFDGTQTQTFNQNIGAAFKFYEITLDIVSTNSTGVFEVYHINLGGSVSFDISTTGTKTVRLHGGSPTNGQFSLRGRSGFVGSIDNVIVKEIAGNNAYQHTSTARPVLQGSAGDYYLDFDGVDDRLLVVSPGYTGTAYIADELGSAAYGVAIPSGTYLIGVNSSATTRSFTKDYVGSVLLDRQMLSPELGALQTYFDDVGAGPYGASAFGGVTNFQEFWRDSYWLTDFPLIDTSQATTLYLTWFKCTSLSSFPLIDSSQVTNFNSAWHSCPFTSFPQLNTSSGTSFFGTWNNCTNLETFPLIDTSNAINLWQAWYNCQSLSSFPAINTSNVIDMRNAWQNCNSLSSFPLVDTSQVTLLANAWTACNNLTSFPEINTSAATEMNSTWAYNYALSSFPLINTSQVTSLHSTWLSCNSLTDFPEIDTRNTNTLYRAWRDCNSLTAFPALNTSSVTNIQEAWQSCLSLSSFPAINTSAVTNMASTWYNCINLSSFPLIDTQSVTSMYGAWWSCSNLSSFPAINTSAVIDMRYTWKACINLTGIPLLDTQSVTSLQQAWYGCPNLQEVPLYNTPSLLDLNNAFFNCTSLTTFPAINTSAVSGTGFQQSWRYCYNISSFPWIDTSKGENFQLTWERLYSISSFPALDFGSATSLDRTWRDCTSLEVFPAGVFDNTSGTTDFSLTFQNCTSLNQQSIDNILVSVNNAGTSNGTITLPGEAPSATGEAAIDSLRTRGWTVTVTGGY